MSMPIRTPTVRSENRYSDWYSLAEASNALVYANVLFRNAKWSGYKIKLSVQFRPSDPASNIQLINIIKLK